MPGALLPRHLSASGALIYDMLSRAFRPLPYSLFFAFSTASRLTLLPSLPYSLFFVSPRRSGFRAFRPLPYSLFFASLRRSGFRAFGPALRPFFLRFPTAFRLTLLPSLPYAFSFRVPAFSFFFAYRVRFLSVSPKGFPALFYSDLSPAFRTKNGPYHIIRTVSFVHFQLRSMAPSISKPL